MVVQACPVTASTVVVAVDVGKNEFAFQLSTSGRQVLIKPQLGRPMTGSGLAQVIAEIRRELPADAVVKVGVEAAGHYHRPLLFAEAWPAGWEVIELNPGQVTAQRKVAGKGTIKTDTTDLQAMAELLLAGHGHVVASRTSVLTDLRAWSAHRTARVAVRTATKNRLLSQLDQTFPGLTRVLPNVLNTKVGQLIVAEFSDPTRLARMGSSRFITFAGHRDVKVRKALADRLIQAAADALPTAEAVIARATLATDLALLELLDEQIEHATRQLALLVPSSPFAPMLTVPGWADVRVGNYGAALGDPTRFGKASQIYRSAGLNPVQYESAGKRRDKQISREGSVELRRALIDLGMGLWLQEPAARIRGQQLRARGKEGLVIACAMAHRANRIAFALVRDQKPYDPDRWSTRADEEA